MYVTPTAFARWSRDRAQEAARALRGGLPWPPPLAVRAIHVPPDPPAPRLPEDWPRPPHLPEEPPIDPRKPPKHDPPDPEESPPEDPPGPKEPPRPEPPRPEPPRPEPFPVPHHPPPRIDARG